MVGEKLNVNFSGVVDFIVWGNINGGIYIDFFKCRVYGYDGVIWGLFFFLFLVVEMIWDKKWMENEFIGLFF